ncbi:MAG: NAD(P)H-dependent oxidoreductase subunit E [Nitrospirae bacterium]|nr:NAD(P)H-dependent oxidoreductase subunit E [Nitrospirota bacterium]
MINENTRKTIERFIRKFPCRDSALVPSLSLIQRENGYVSEADMEELAKILRLSEARIFSVASFYTILSLKPIGKYHIQVCSNVVCSLLDGYPLVDYIAKILGIREGETTPDGMFSLASVECLGSCGYAPALQINMEHYENLTYERIEEIVEMLRSGEVWK